MTSQKPVFSLEEYAESVLAELGLANLSPAEKETYIPRLVHNIEYRLGAELLPLVPDSHAPEFQKLLEDDADSPAWFEFWKRVIPDFENKVKTILQNFALECQKILA